MIAQSTVVDHNKQLQQKNPKSQTVIDFIYKWGLTNNDASEVFEVSPVTISRWINGHVVPTGGYAIAAELLDEKWQKEGKPKMILWW